jgi:hydroxymethylglutaryl-CoA reductase
MIGQIQIIELLDPNKAKSEILKNKKKLLKHANDQDPILLSLGGGAQDIEVNVIKTNSEIILVVHLIVNCLDAMGANAINTMSESIAPLLEKISNGKVLLRIISNLAVKRLVRSNAIFDKDSVGGEKIVDLIIKSYEFADSDPYRCATHNKGIMNGITSVALATGQDTRAIEAGAHSYASFHGQYKSLTTWEKNTDGNLVGTIELPLAVGLIGGATAVHPIAKACLNILGINNVTDLSAILASVGLAQNLGALRALVSEGIQKGHMKLHARNLAVSAGATGELIDKVANHMIKNSSVRFDIAKSLISKLKK